MSSFVITPPMWTDSPESVIHAWEIRRSVIDDITYVEEMNPVSDWVFVDANMFADEAYLPLEEHDHYANKIHGFVAWDLTWPGKAPADFDFSSVPRMLRLFIPGALWGDHTGQPVPPIPRLNFRWMSAAELTEMFPPIDASEAVIYPPVVSPFGYVPSSQIVPHFSIGFDRLVAAENGTLEIPLDGTGFPGGTFFALRMWITGVDPEVIGFDQWGFAFTMIAMADREVAGVMWHGPQLVYEVDDVQELEFTIDARLILEAEIAVPVGPPVYDRAKRKRGW